MFEKKMHMNQQLIDHSYIKDMKLFGSKIERQREAITVVVLRTK
jgi:hypothetical protein